MSVSSQTEFILKPLYSCDENEIFIFNDNMVLCAVQKTKEKYKLNIFFCFIKIIQFRFRLNHVQRDTRVLYVANIYRLLGR